MSRRAIIGGVVVGLTVVLLLLSSPSQQAPPRPTELPKDITIGEPDDPTVLPALAPPPRATAAPSTSAGGGGDADALTPVPPPPPEATPAPAETDAAPDTPKPAPARPDAAPVPPAAATPAPKPRAPTTEAPDEPEPPAEESAAPVATEPGCAATLAQRKHADAHYVANHLNHGFPPGGKRRRQLLTSAHVDFTCNLTSVPTDWALLPHAPKPIMTTAADYASGTDFITVDAAATMFGHELFVSSSVAVNAKTGFVIDRTIKRAASGAHPGLSMNVPLIAATVNRIYHTLRSADASLVKELPDTADGYLWCTEWFYPRDDLLMHDLINVFASHYDLHRTTGRNATLLIPSMFHHWPLSEWIPFVQRHYAAPVMFLPPVARTVYRGKLTFAATGETGYSASAARFVSEVLAPRVLEACARDGAATCSHVPFPLAALDATSVRRGSPASLRDPPIALPEDTLVAKTALALRGVIRVTLPTGAGVSMEQRAFQAMTADVLYLQWGVASGMEKMLAGAFVAAEKLPWKRRSTSLMSNRAARRLGGDCTKPRPPQRVVMLASGSEVSSAATAAMTRSTLFGHMVDSLTPNWYADGEDVALMQIPGSVAKVSWLGATGAQWHPQALEFDDGAFDLDRPSLALVDAGANAAIAEVRDDVELLDHLVRTSRTFLFNQWLAQSTHALPLKAKRAARAFPEPSVGDSLTLSAGSLFSSAVKGDGPKSKKLTVARRTGGTAPYLLSSSCEAFAQARIPDTTSGTVLAAYFKAVGGAVIAVGGDTNVVAPNSHPCFGILDEVRLPSTSGEKCATLSAQVAGAWSGMKDASEAADQEGVKAAVWLVPTQAASAMLPGAMAQLVLSRLGHLVLDGTLADGSSGASISAVLPEDLPELAEGVAKTLLKLFGITSVVKIKQGTPLRFASTKVLVPPALEGFRHQFSAHQFAATRWLAANSEAAKIRRKNRRKVVLALRFESDGAYVNETASAVSALTAAGITAVIDVGAEEALRHVQHAGTLVVMFGDAMLYYVSMWADALRVEALAATPGESGRRRHLNLIVLCPPLMHSRCQPGQDFHPRSRFYSTGGELNLPRGVHIAYQLVTDPDGAYAAATEAMPVHQLITGGHLANFGEGLPRNYTGFGIMPSAGAAGARDKIATRRLRRGFRDTRQR